MKDMFSGATSFNNGGQPLTLDTAKATSVSTCIQLVHFDANFNGTSHVHFMPAFTDEGNV